MRLKKKGAVLVLTLVVTSMLFTFAVTISAIASHSYAITIVSERNNRLKLMAEAGRERGEAELKNYLYTNRGTIFTPSGDFNPSGVISSGSITLLDKTTGGNIRCTVSILPNTADGSTVVKTFGDDIPSSVSASLPRQYPDTPTNRMLDYVLIRSVATNIKTGEIKVLDTYLDRKTISNIYFDRLFNSSFTVASDPINPLPATVSAFKLNNDNVKLNLAGTMFLQGDTIEIKPITTWNLGNLMMSEGEIYANAKSLTLPSGGLVTTDEAGVINSISLNKPSSSTSKAGWNNTLIRGLDLLPINPGGGPIQQITSTGTGVTGDTFKNIEEVDGLNDIEFKYAIQSTPTHITIPTLITYKVKAVTAGAAINFRQLINGNDLSYTSTGVYIEIINKLKVVPGHETDYESVYGKVYKLIMVDGDLNIEDKPDNTHEEYNNYIIYCTGNVSFKGNADFKNCSIFAKSITFDEPAPSIYTVNFSGVNTAKSRSATVNGMYLFDFNEADKRTINSYLLDNLTGYGDYIRFRSIDWRQY